jgi:lysophospholipase L1-like esterase
MSNNANEGHPGALISQIATYANISLHLRPNIILLMAGTNDVNIDYEADTAPQRLVDLVDECVTACPDAVVLVAQLTPILDSDAQARVEAFNAAFPPLLEQTVGAGKKVLVVDMENYVTVDELMDGLHPGDLGYEGMARAWFDGITEAASKGWIAKPIGSATSSAHLRKRTVFSDLWGPVGVIGLMLLQWL